MLHQHKIWNKRKGIDTSVTMLQQQGMQPITLITQVVPYMLDQTKETVPLTKLIANGIPHDSESNNAEERYYYSMAREQFIQLSGGA
jgi:hypothetical protein